MARINTTKMLSNDGYFTGGIDTESLNNTTIAISPMVYDQYDYSITEDISLDQDRADTQQKLYEIFIKSPFVDVYTDKETNIIKIPKEDISKVFYYMKEHLSKIKTISAFETVIAINEFFDFNYEFIAKKVISSKMMAEILEDYYINMGMSERIDEVASDPLF